VKGLIIKRKLNFPSAAIIHFASCKTVSLKFIRRKRRCFYFPQVFAIAEAKTIGGKAKRNFMFAETENCHAMPCHWQSRRRERMANGRWLELFSGEKYFYHVQV
jgi:hypothetical protein